MQNVKQILDVTYGAFSCRLEGFDDPVETMKAVVCFFHELAGDTRFLDMPPQAPDLETLKTLTEEQSGESVAVTQDDRGLRLVVSDAGAPAAAEDAPAVDETEASEAPQDTLGVEGEVARAIEPAVDPLDEGATVADKLAHIRNVISDAAADDAAPMAEDAAESVESAEAALSSTDDGFAAATLADDDAPLAADSADVAPLSTEESAPDMLSSATAEGEMDEAPEPVDAPDDTQNGHGSDLADESDMDDKLILRTAAPEALADAAIEDADVPADDDVSKTGILRNVIADAIQPASPASEDAPAAKEVAAEAPAEDSPTEEMPVEAPATPEPFVLTPSLALPVEDTTPAEEIALVRDIAKVEAELAAQPEKEFTLAGLPRSVEDAMSRILSQTDQQMNAPESIRHRDAFAQLKAAVVATEAARQLGERSKILDPEGAFKDDLGAHSVESPSATMDPSGAAGAAANPLQLATSQAVTLTDVARSEPLDPASEKLRRIAKLKDRDLTGVTKVSFADFLAETGAGDLSELLEAAAAYLTFIDGETEFSRPQVMKLAQTVSENEISREDGLRAFGRLLRQARFIKLNNGRFKVSGKTAYRPEKDQAAQG